MGLQELLKQLQGDLSQKDFATKLGVSQPYLSMVLSGQRGPGRQMMATLLAVFPSRAQEIKDSFFASRYHNSTEAMTDVLDEPEAEEQA